MSWLSSVVSQAKKAVSQESPPAKTEHNDAAASDDAPANEASQPKSSSAAQGSVKGTFNAVVAVTSSSVGYVKRSVATLGSSRVTYIPVMPLPQRQIWSPPDLYDDSTPYDVIIASFPDPPRLQPVGKPAVDAIAE